MDRIKKFAVTLLHLNGATYKTLPLLLAFSVALVVANIKSINFNMTNFYERAIGHASINGVDAPMRVTAFWTCLAIFALSFLLGSHVIEKVNGYLTKKFSKDTFEMEKNLLFEFGILLFLNELIFLYVYDWHTSSKAQVPKVLFLCFSFAAVCVHSLISVFMAHKKIANETTLQSALAFLLPVPLTYFVLLATSFNNSAVAVISVKAAAVYFAFYLEIRFLLNRKKRKIRPVAAGYALIPLSFLPMMYVIGSEAQYTLTKHGVVVSPKIIAMWLSVFLVAVAALMYRLKRNVENDESAIEKIETIIIPALLVTVAIFAAHYQTIAPDFDLLHNGNKTLPAQQFLQFGKIPLLDIWEHQNLPILPFIYGALNGLNLLEQNIWLGMSFSIVNILICYFVVKQVVGARWTALLILFTPLISYANAYYMAGLLPLVYLKQMRAKRSAFAYGVFFGLGLFSFVYHSSSGMFAVMSSLALIALSCSSKKNVINAVKGVAIATIVPTFIYFSYVFWQGESIADRLAMISALRKQDILICAYSYLLSPDRTRFEILVYLGLFPMLGMILAYLALRPEKKTFANYGIVFISVASIICSTRALARHSLVEGLPTDYYPLLFVLFPFVMLKGETRGKIVSSFVIALLLLTPYVPTEFGIAAAGVKKTYAFRQFEMGDERCDTLNNPAYPANLRKVLDTVLTDDQTFFETINGYLLYALMERECTFLPVATLMIQYERPQIAYIHTLEKLYEKNRVPVIITGQSDWGGAAIDGIPSELSLFKLEEWIYGHYKPWIRVDGFHLWKADNSGIKMPDSAKTSIDFQEAGFIKQDFNMIMLPYVWGNYDKKVNKHFPEEQQRLADVLPLEAETPVKFTLDMDIDKSDGNYIHFKIDAEQSGSLSLTYGNDIVNSCNFNMAAGEYNYLVRISSQYNWGSEPQSWLEVKTDIPVTVERISVLRGD